MTALFHPRSNEQLAKHESNSPGNKDGIAGLAFLEVGIRDHYRRQNQQEVADRRRARADNHSSLSVGTDSDEQVNSGINCKASQRDCDQARPPRVWQSILYNRDITVKHYATTRQ